MSSKPVVVLLLTIAVAAFLRFYQLDSIPPGLYADEAFNGNEAVAAWRTGQFHIYYPENHGQEGLLIALQALAFGLTGQARPWVLRLPGAMLGVATIVGLYALARQVGLRRTAWLAAWLMATSFWHISISRTVDLRVAPVFFLVWSLWLWREGESRGSLLWAGIAGLVYGLGFYTYQAYRVTPLLLAIAACRRGLRERWRVAAIAVVVAALTVLPLAIYAFHEPAAYFHRVTELRSLTTAHPLRDLLHNVWATAGMFHLAGDLNPRHNLPGHPMLFWLVGILFLLGGVVAFRRQRFLLWWLGVGLLPAVVANEGVPHAGRAALAMPAVFMLAALGAEWVVELLERWRRPAIAPVLAALLALVTAFEGYRLYFVRWARDPRVAEWFDSSLLKVADRLNALPPELPKYMILDPDPTIVHGLPVAAETIKFLTDTATPERQEAKNLHYLWPDQTNQIARGYVYVYHIETTQP